MPQKALTRGARSEIVTKDNVHLQRYLRAKIGLTPEEIAKEHGVSVETVKGSIAKIDTYRALHTLEFANEAAVGIVVGSANIIQRAILRGAVAKKRVIVGDKTEMVDDFAIQAKSVENFTALVTAIQPRGGKPVNVNVNANANSQSTAVSHSETRTMGFEERLRHISKKVEQESSSKSEIGTTFDDEVIEAEEKEEGVLVPDIEEGGDGSPK